MNGSIHTHNPVEFKIEFLIPCPDSARVLRDQSSIGYIQSLFEVSVSASGTQTPRGEWIALRGKQEHTAKAKKYILALCSPEVRVETCIHPSFAQFLFSGEGVKMRRQLEREHQAVLTRGVEGVVLIQGVENDVYATNTRLINLMGTFENGHIRQYPPPKPIISYGQPTPNDQTLYDHKPFTRPPSHETPHYKSVIARGGDPGREKRIQYFVNLGYSRDMVETVLCSLSDADDDVVLNRLVQCTPPQPRAPGSVVDPLPVRPVNPELLRHIVIDGSNVAMKHGNGVFSCKGIQLAVDYFKRRGHSKITVFVPAWRKETSTPDFPITNQHILRSLEQDDHLKYTPSRRIEGRRIVCYDDRFIIKLATDEQGVIVSNDQYRDLVREKAEWKEVIETRLLQFTFANDYFMPPDDPLGRNGPTLDQLLSKDPLVSSSSVRGKKPLVVPGQQQCPFGERCTFGRKCKYYHPDRETSSSNPSTASHTPSTSRSPTPSPSPDKRHIVRSREDLVKPSVYHENQISLPELNDRMSQMTMIHNRPESINLQQYPPQIMRSNPSLPTPQDPTLQPAYEGAHQERRQLHHTFPLLTLPAQHNYDRRYTEDLTHQAVTPSRPPRAHTHEHEYQYDQPHRHLTGFPGPHPHPVGYVPRDGGTGNNHLRGVQSLSPRHYPHPPHSHSYPQLVPSPQPPRLRAHRDHAPFYDETVFRKALAVLPGCEERLRRVFNQYPMISNYEEAVDIARRID